MVNNDVLHKLFKSFPAGNINHNLEFIADPHRQVNSYFRLEDCETVEDVTAKVLEWLSREAYKSEHFYSHKRNEEVHAYHLQGINSFCGTNFGKDDIHIIYCRLGNRVNHPLTLDFIRSGYNMAVLTKEEE